ncbi:MAG: hypothetical protein U9Q82_15380 [Chloroflexota bacterium]|nr:hypothetical protein [Chloroflexota bacterium]
MTNDWNPRNHILALTHRWYLIVLCFLAGALLGWGASQTVPPSYRAELDLYVGINAYRGPRDRYILSVAQDDFENVGDYKNWQMEQLNTLARQDVFLADTLDRLVQTDDRWGDISVKMLHDMLKGSWRNAGRWHLTAETPQRDMAVQAVESWAVVIAERVNAAIDHARQVVALDSSLAAISDELVLLEQRSQTLSQVNKNLQAIRQDLDNLDQDERLDSLTRWDMFAQASRAAGWNSGWGAALDDFPAPDALPADYALWLDRTLSIVAADLEALPAQIDSLEVQHAAAAAAYADEAEKSLALSANMSLETSAEVAPQVEVVRPSSLLMLVGGFLGVLFWLLWELARATQDGEK